MKVVKRTFLLAFGVFLCSNKCLGNGNSTDDKHEDSFLINLIWECTKTQDVAICLKSKAVSFLENLIRTKEPIPITDFMSLAKDPQQLVTADEDVDITDSETEVNSVEEEQERNDRLDGEIWEKLNSLFRTRTLQLTLPSDSVESRGKEGKILKKGYGMFMMAAMMGGMMMKMALGKVALIAGKALIIGKIALILSLVLSLKKFLGSNGGGGGHPEVVYASSEPGSAGWQRNFKLDPGSITRFAFNDRRL